MWSIYKCGQCPHFFSQAPNDLNDKWHEWQTLTTLTFLFLPRAFFRCNNYHHTFPVHAGELFWCAEFLQFFQEAQQQEFAAVFKHNRAAPELNVGFYFIPFGKEIFGVAELELEIVLAGFRAEADFFELLFHRVGLHLLFLFSFLVEEFVVVHNAGHRRIGIWRNFNQIKFYFFGPTQELRSCIYAGLYLLADGGSDFFQVVANEAQFRNPDMLIDTMFCLLLPGRKRASDATATCGSVRTTTGATTGPVRTAAATGSVWAAAATGTAWATATSGAVLAATGFRRGRF